MGKNATKSPGAGPFEIIQMGPEIQLLFYNLTFFVRERAGRGPVYRSGSNFFFFFFHFFISSPRI